MAMNICVKCTYDKDGVKVWRNHRCRHPSVRRGKILNPITGIISYLQGSIEQFPLCRDVNCHGTCKLYEEREDKRTRKRRKQ